MQEMCPVLHFSDMLLWLLVVQNTLPITLNLCPCGKQHLFRRQEWQYHTLNSEYCTESKGSLLCLPKVATGTCILIQPTCSHCIHVTSILILSWNIHFYQDLWQKSCINFILFDFITVTIQYLVINVTLPVREAWHHLHVMQITNHKAPHYKIFSFSLYSILLPNYTALLKHSQPMCFPCGERHLTHNKLQVKLYVCIFSTFGFQKNYTGSIIHVAKQENCCLAK